MDKLVAIISAISFAMSLTSLVIVLFLFHYINTTTPDCADERSKDGNNDQYST